MPALRVGDGTSMTDERELYQLALDRIKSDRLLQTKYRILKKAGYTPHLAQLVALTSRSRFSTRSAGRRSGKTRGTAWEVAYLCLVDYQRAELAALNVSLPADDEPIMVAIVTPRSSLTSVYKRTRRDFFYALNKLGLRNGAGYEYKKSEAAVFFPREEGAKCIVEFKSVSEPDSLQGDGYHVVWMDEAGSYKGGEAYSVLRPTLTNTRGIIFCSTTPGRSIDNWWFWEEFVAPVVGGKRDNGENIPLNPRMELIEWYSVESPWFPKDEWEAERERLSHDPEQFAREYMATWTLAAKGKFNYDWVNDNKFSDADLHKHEDGTIAWERYRVWVGVDPAISLKTSADYFVATVMLQDKDTGIAYIYKQYRDRLEIDEQLKLMAAVQKAHRPLAMGVEKVQYQAALVQQLKRHPDIHAYVHGVEARDKKEDRIWGLSGGIRTGQVRFHASLCELDNPLMTEYLQFPNGRKDDCLDSVEIALRTADTLVGQSHFTNTSSAPSGPRTMGELARAQLRQQGEGASYSEFVGSHV